MKQIHNKLVEEAELKYIEYTLDLEEISIKITYKETSELKEFVDTIIELVDKRYNE